MRNGSEKEKHGSRHLCGLFLFLVIRPDADEDENKNKEREQGKWKKD